MLISLGPSPSFGFGDRVGPSVAGHIAAAPGADLRVSCFGKGRSAAQSLGLPSLLADARQGLCVTFGSTLAEFGVELKAALANHEDACHEGLQRHSTNHLRLLKEPT